ncbi:MAG: helix-turn-helix transcriptional regulator [Blastocatellia bacterium]|nr:helix-turn-helix transcriptional regulator [Blastocatellia bacterium]
MTLDVIERNMTSGLSIQMLAEQIGMGTHRFTREFKNATGRTPYQFIMELRIEKARALLEKTNLPLAEIALELGFASQSHFTAVFRQHVNTTPRTYRALFRSH